MYNHASAPSLACVKSKNGERVFEIYELNGEFYTDDYVTHEHVSSIPTFKSIEAAIEWLTEGRYAK